MRQYALWAMALFVFSIPSENGVVIPGVGSLSRLVGVVAFVLTVVSMFERGRFRFRAPTVFLAVAALFMAWGAMTYFWSIDPGTTLARTATLVQLGVSVWVIHQLARNPRDQDVFRQAFVLGCYVVIGVAIAVFAGPTGGFRQVGAFNPNGLAIVTALAIPMAWGLSVRSAFPSLNALNAIYPLFSLVAVVLTASRGGFVTAVIAVAIVPILLSRVGLLRRVVLFVAIVATVWAALVLVPRALPELRQNLERLAGTDEELLEGTLTGRTMIWRAGLIVFMQQPIQGIGLGGFNLAASEELGKPKSPHNAFISVAVESGLVGLGLFLTLFVVVLVGTPMNPVRRAEHLVLLVTLVVGMMPTNSHNDKFVWLILALLASARPFYVLVADAPPRELPNNRLVAGARPRKEPLEPAHRGRGEGWPTGRADAPDEVRSSHR